MPIIAAIFLLSPLISVLAPAAIVLMVALVIFCSGAGIQLSTNSLIVLFCIAAAVPISALFGAALLRRVFELSGDRRGIFELFVMVIATALTLRASNVATLFGAASFLGSGRSAGAMLATISLTVSHALFAAGLAAFVVSCIIASAEFLSGWFTHSVNSSQKIISPALRQIIALLVLSAGFDLAAGVFSRELAPFTILKDIFG